MTLLLFFNLRQNNTLTNMRHNKNCAKTIVSFQVGQRRNEGGGKLEKSPNLCQRRNVDDGEMII